MTLNESTREYIVRQIRKARHKAEMAETMARTHDQKDDIDLALCFQVDAEVYEATVERLEEMLIKNQMYR